MVRIIIMSAYKQNACKQLIAFVWMKDCDKLTVNTKLLAVTYEMIAMTTGTDTDIDFVMVFTKIPFNLTLRFST